MLAAAILLTLGVVYFIFNPATSTLFPHCPFLVMTGLKCPGCGSQRAIHSLLHLNIGSAISYNFMLVASIPLVAILIYAELRRKTSPTLYSRINKPAFTWAIFAIFTAWWILRNIFDW